MDSKDIVIVSRHQGLVEWLAKHGIVGTVIAHATAEQVRGKHVFGVLPMHLAALAYTVTVVDMPRLLPGQRGQDLTPAEMDAAGADLVTYGVLDMDSWGMVGELIDSLEAIIPMALDGQYDFGGYVPIAEARIARWQGRVRQAPGAPEMETA